MKKILILITIILFVFSSHAFADENIKVILDGKEINFLDVKPTIIKGSTMVPLRKIFEELEVDVTFDKESNKIISKKDYLDITLKLGSNIAKLNNKEIKLNSKPIIKNKRVLVPVRFISESLGAKVTFDDLTNKVIISSPPKDTLVGITKYEALKDLINLLDIKKEVPVSSEDKDIYIYLAKENNLIKDDINFNNYITKEELKLMFIRGIGYNNKLNTEKISDSPCTEMYLKMYEKIKKPLDSLHGFYAIKSYPQRNLISEFDSIGFGWSQFVFNGEDVELSIDKENSFYLPEGAYDLVDNTKDEDIIANLTVYASNRVKNKSGIGLIEHIIKDKESIENYVDSIVDNLKVREKGKNIKFNGVIIDFEDIKSEKLKGNYNMFLKTLNKELDKKDKLLYVMLQPNKYYKGYDYKTIGNISDKVILMAHDYQPKKEKDLNIYNINEDFYDIESPLAPIKNNFNKDFDVYSALEEITNKETGIEDKDKIFLQLSLGASQWRRHNNKENIKIESIQTTLEKVRTRMEKQRDKDDLNIQYNKEYQAPFLTYYDESNDIDNIIWYEDSRSIQSKINLAKLFDIRGISLWRLGMIPEYEEDFGYLNIWDTILKNYENNN
ncbi:MAG: hypothetical protein FH751_13620 [Firmicutes bacterium]|nr:hypothetical protein [Bacillota bacterium]